jgi:hypothetical protein
LPAVVDVTGMNGLSAAGVALTTVGVAGYAVGLLADYPGRAFSLTAVMAGAALALVGRSEGSS